MRVSASSCVLRRSPCCSVLRMTSASSLLRDDEQCARVAKPGFARLSSASRSMISFGLEQDLAGAPRRRRPRRAHAAQRVRSAFLPASRRSLLSVVEELEDLAVGDEAERLQQHGDRELPLPVDVHVHDVVDVEAELHPRAAVRDDARGDRAACRSGWTDSSKNTPGERWSWVTITRSAPLMMKVPLSVMIGSSPR